MLTVVEDVGADVLDPLDEDLLVPETWAVDAEPEPEVTDCPAVCTAP